jgi:hypothetical protein
VPSEPPPIDPAWLDRILRRFADGTLPPSEFGHRAHLVIALSHARSFGDDALVILRAALREYLMRHAGDTRAYHETMTAAWLRLIDVFDRPHRTLALVEAAARLVARFPDKHALAAHYTTERLMSDAARARWLDPDLAPLPGR